MLSVLGPAARRILDVLFAVQHGLITYNLMTFVDKNGKIGRTQEFIVLHIAIAVVFLLAAVLDGSSKSKNKQKQN